MLPPSVAAEPPPSGALRAPSERRPRAGREEVVCHCLNVTASAIRSAVVIEGCRTVREVLGVTQAGGGCTACHHRIAELIDR